MVDGLTKRIQLEAMLTLLGGAITAAHRLNKDVAEYVRQRDGVAEIRTEDRAVGRRFYISHGRVRVRRGTHPGPDYAMVYKDIPAALTTMAQGTEEATMQAISEGELRFEGDLAFGMWFLELLKMVGRLIKDPRQIVSL